MNFPTIENPPKLVPVVLVCNEEYWLPYVLEAARPHFERFVIYDVGSTDRTRAVIEWFTRTSPGIEFVTRFLPMVSRDVQGTFRNAMIADARSEHYLILDGDEIYTPEAFEALKKAAASMTRMYGVVSRQEWTEDLRGAYGVRQHVPHHRIYRRDAVWRGPHPGERPFYEQHASREETFRLIRCHHFHHAPRSPMDAVTPGRLARKDNPTYHRGEVLPANLLEELPILRRRIADFAVSPALEALWNGLV